MKAKPDIRNVVVQSYLREPPAGEQGAILDCSLGVNQFGTSPMVLEAARDYDWSKAWLYPAHTYKELKGKICKFWADYAKLTIEQVQVSHGASAILDGLNRIFIGPGSKLLGYSPQFADYVGWVEACGGKYDSILLVPEEKFEFGVERLLARISEEHCLVYVDNPNNPTGQLIKLEEIEEIVKQAGKKDVVVVVDEAYGDYVGREHSALRLMNEHSNLAVVRSFSKGFGLAGLRLGYGVFSPELSGYYRKIDIPFSVSMVSCDLAGAALLDQGFIHDCCKTIEREKQKLTVGLRRKGYLVSETCEACPIFVLGCKSKDTDLMESLLERGILTVSGMDFRNLGSNYVRVNTPPSAQEFLARL